ncbi:hypothetical protein [Brooklawnia sp.]|uniref:hypothetical protein n=1 Tax=Brooklawnia sp. TaxID=2699740 RepID=UPI00311EAAEB
MENEIVADGEILADERRRQRKYGRIYRIATAALLLAAGVGVIFAGFSVSARSGWIVLIGIVAMIAVVVAMNWRMDRKSPEDLVTTGPWSWGQVYSGSQSREIWNAMGPLIMGYGLGITRLTRNTAMLERKASLLYRKGIHLLDVRPSVDHPGWHVITVQSAPDLPTSLTDFGRGRTINTQLLGAVPAFRKPGDPDLAIG